MDRRIELREFVSIMAMFLFAQFGGLLFIIWLLPPAALAPLPASAVTVTTAVSGVPILLVWVLELIVVSALMILLFKYIKMSLIFQVFGLLAVGGGIAIAVLFILGTYFAQLDFNIQLVIAAVIAIGLYLLMYKIPQLKNTLVIISVIGIGAIGIAFPFSLAYAFFAILTIYDYLAVFVTKHMVTLANMAMSYNLPLLVDSSSVEIVPRDKTNEKDFAEMKKEMQKGNIKNPVFKDIINKGNVPTVSRVALGNGDIGIPLLFAISAYSSFLNYFIPVVMIIGSAAGLAFTFYILKKYKVILPALPPIFGVTNLALGVAFLVTGQGISLAALFFVIGIISSFVVYDKARKIYESTLR